MKSADLIKTREELQIKLQQAIRENNTDAFYEAFDKMLENIAECLCREYQGQVDQLQQSLDSRILASRGVHQLTSKELEYYQKLGAAMAAHNPKQALANLDVVMPETIIDSVFDDLRTNHPLLSLITFNPTNGAIKMIMNTNGYQEAAWGKLCDDIIKELTSGFVEVDTSLFKLSAFLPVCKAMLDLGPQWLDRYVRDILYEALANGLEAGLVDGDGNDKPIGMTRQVGEGVTVTGGVYPRKNKIKLNAINPATIGGLISLLVLAPNGKQRPARNVVFIVNPQDYFQKVMPATTLMAPDGTYRNDVMPYPMTVIQSPALKKGEAILGLSNLYFAAAGASKEGQIEYSDHYRFLEDERVYIIKTYANGMPMDNNAFLLLDISELTPMMLPAQMVDPPAASADATLADLKIGALALSPAFAAATTSYTAATTNASNTVTATPADAGATIEITVGDKPTDNGSAVTWASGANTVKIKVTAADGTATKTYTVTVTKS